MSKASNSSAVYRGYFLPHMTAQALNRDLGRTVIRMSNGDTISAGNFRDQTSRICQAFSSLGLEAGARIGVLSGNRVEVLYVMTAASLNEYVLVPLHPKGSLEDYAYVAEDAALDALVFDPDAFESCVSELLQNSARSFIPIPLGRSHHGQSLMEIASECSALKLPSPALRGDGMTRLSYSGGTTGKPKAIIGTHTYQLACLTAQLTEWEWPSEIRQLICAPLSHSGASMFTPTLLRDGFVVVLPAFDPVAVMQAIEEHKINCILLVPTMIYALLDHPRFHEFDLSSLEVIFYGASAISPARLREGIEKIGPVFFQFYGQAEAPMTVTVLRRHEHDPEDLSRLSSCGRPVPWMHVTLLDDDGNEVEDGEPGEICVRGPIVMAGYLNKPEQTEEAFRDGWLHTGDVAVRDADGYLHIVDRKKDMIISGGFNVYPREIEDVLGTHPAVAQSAVIGIADDKWGEAVKAIVVLREGEAHCADELIALVRERKGAVQAPKSVDFVDEIPQTAVGKPDKKALRVMYDGRR